jgi:2-alkyl-3-oxoalkanoate reductase
MRIFVTGATGLLGRVLVPELIEHGHDIIGLARNDASRSMITAMHATAYSGQGHDVDQLAEGLEPVHAVVHLATGFPNNDAPVEDDWTHSSKIVLGMLRYLIEASERTGVRTIVLPSFYGVYADRMDNWVTEESPIEPDNISQSYLEAEQLLHDTSQARRSSAVILRMGQLYSAEAPHTRGLLYALQNGQAAVGQSPDAYWPLVHVADAAQAIRLALELSPAGHIFNVCDNEPVRKAELYRDLAKWIGAPPPPERSRTGALSPYMGRMDATALHKSVRMSNEKARTTLGFAPLYANHEAGFAAVMPEWRKRQQAQN